MRLKSAPLNSSIALAILSVLIAGCDRGHESSTTDQIQIDQARVVVKTATTHSSDYTPTPATDQQPAFDPDAYDFRCADGLLGMATTDQLFPSVCSDNCRPPTTDELVMIETCLLDSGTTKASGDTETQPAPGEDGTMFDPAAYDIKCLDRVLGGAAAHAISDTHRAPTNIELEQI